MHRIRIMRKEFKPTQNNKQSLIVIIEEIIEKYFIVDLI